MNSAAAFRSASLPGSALPPAVWLIVLGAALLPGLACGGRRHGPPADLVLLDGAVLTLDPDRPGAEAVAVRAGFIAAVGSNREILDHAGPATRPNDLGGRMVLPGLVDAHAHVRSLGGRLSNLDLRGAGSPDEVARRVSSGRGLPPGARPRRRLGPDLWPTSLSGYRP
jgi:cytosine/adenosine deaminase-related metal-dependent hydrolase